MLRGFLLKQSKLEIQKTKLATYTAIACTENAETRQKIASTFRDFVNLAAFLEEEVKQREIDMSEEYKYWSTVKAKLTKDKSGAYIVSGIKLDN